MRVVLPLTLLISIVTTNLLVAAPEGIILYRPYPSATNSAAIAAEYSSIKFFAHVINFIPEKAGTREKRVERGNFIKVIKYTDMRRTSVANSKEYQQFLIALNELKDAIKDYPASKQFLEERVREMETAKQMISQGNVLVHGIWYPKAKSR